MVTLLRCPLLLHLLRRYLLRLALHLGIFGLGGAWWLPSLETAAAGLADTLAEATGA